VFHFAATRARYLDRVAAPTGRSAAARAQLLLAVVAVVLLLPLLGGPPASGSQLVAVSVALVVAAAAFALACGLTGRSPGLLVVVPGQRAHVRAPLRTRVTDPQHHPLAPRAPGRG
jgi:hypothetical protein